MTAATWSILSRVEAELKPASAIRLSPDEPVFASKGPVAAPMFETCQPSASSAASWRDDPCLLADSLIDAHGRWARHVALQHVIASLMAEDEDGETLWRVVFSTIMELQTRRTRQSNQSMIV